MTDRRHSIHEMDLLAYADGLLDKDPGRKAEVEAYLQQHPKEAARVRDYAEQNDAIRQLYGSILAEPVPERLQAILENHPRRPVGQVARAAIAASLLLTAGFAGWLIGKSGQPDPWQVQDFVEQALTTYARPSPASNSIPDIALQEANQPFNWLTQQLTMPLQPPDLTPQGFTLIDKHLMRANGPQTAQVTYAASSGRRLSLFLRTRWQEEAPQFHFAENEGVTMVYWLDGPLVYALVGHLDRQEMLAVVQAVRRSMRHQPQGSRPQMHTSGGPQVPHMEPEIAPVGDSLLVPHDPPARINPAQSVTQTDERVSTSGRSMGPSR
jgi:anti-sigma factor RsiW